MKRGTESRVFLGKDTSVDEFTGINVLSTVLLGKKEGGFKDHNGLFIASNVTLGKGIARIITVVVYGTSPLSLPNAIEADIVSLKAFGGTEQETETIIQTATAQGKTEQRNLPDGYTQLEYIASTGGTGQYINTGIVPTINAKARVVFAPTNRATTGYWGARNDPNRFCCTTFNSGAAFGVGMTVNSWPVNRTTCTLDTVYDCVIANGYANVDGTEYTETAVSSFGNAGGFVLGGSASGQGLQYAAARFYICQLWESNVLVFDGIPARRNSDNVLGMYDLVSGQFFINQGSGTFEAGPVAVPTPDTPMDIVSNNGVLKAYTNLVTNTFQGNIDASGKITSVSNPWYINIVPVTPGTTYTGSPVKVYTFYTTLPTIGSVSYNNSRVVISDQGTQTITVPNDPTIKYLAFRSDNEPAAVCVLGNDISNLNKTYTDGTQETITDNLDNVATCERLLQVGTYTDTQEILSGVVTRNVGVKVLDGTENWAVNTMISHHFTWRLPNQFDSSVAYKPTYCTHFLSDSGVDDNTCKLQYRLFSIRYDAANENINTFKQWLADQYAAGTPVIVIYPLATATTESVTGQNLRKEPLTVTGSLPNLLVNTTTGDAVPTPEYPLDIVCNNGVLKVSPNLFHLNEGTLSGVDLTINSDGAYVLNGTAQSNRNFATQDMTLSAGTYQLALLDKTIIDTPGTQVQVLSVSSGMNVVINMNSSDTSQTFTISETLSDVAIRLRISQGAIYDNLVIKPMLVKSDVVPTTYIPYGSIYADGTVETINVHGKNLLDNNQKIIASANLWRYLSTAETGGGITLKAGTSYTLSATEDVYVYLYDYAAQTSLASGRQKITYTPATDVLVYIQVYSVNGIPEDTLAQLELGSTATDYEPYYDGGTATAEMLLKVGDYQDVQSILDGVVTRNVGVKVLDGTENWNISGSTYYINIPELKGISSRIGLSTHFPCANSSSVSVDCFGFGGAGTTNGNVLFNIANSYTLEEFQQFLANQYAAGTPVIVIYPLATPTTESVTGQTLQVTDGDNIVEITQASMDGLTLEVTYLAGATVTIQEVENAQLSDDVDVTIH